MALKGRAGSIPARRRIIHPTIIARTLVVGLPFNLVLEELPEGRRWLYLPQRGNTLIAKSTKTARDPEGVEQKGI